ncbi:MAG: VanW family protein [Eubacterium sp.]|nr:VanW family protein [Eubacterium sp.]
MKRKRIKNFLCAVAAFVLVFSLVSCAAEQANEEATTTTAATTTERTTVTTTEDEKTTFPENKTNKIYPGLSKDENGSYPYKLATYSTYYHTSDKTRTANLKKAVSKVNNIVVPSNGVFSFNQTVGKRTVTAGYETAKVVADGEFVDGLGGGVCQVSSTIFECVLRANAQIVERSCHTLKVAYVPLGGDATVQWNSKDFKFRNSSSADFRINMVCDSGKLTCTVYSNKDIDVGKIGINISRSGSSYVLTRTVNGEQNYRTISTYREQKPSTTKKKEKTTKKKEKTTKKETTEKATTKKESEKEETTEKED